MATSGRSGSSSSYHSSLGVPTSFGFVSTNDSTFPPGSTVSAATTESSSAPNLALGPPGYHATIKLLEGTANEITVYLGPWCMVERTARRVVWQCSYANETLEDFLPSNNPAGVFPYTLHAQHRRFGDPWEMELYVAFTEPHRIRYTTASGVVHDQLMDVRYEFTRLDYSMQFQGDIRRKDLIDWFDVDVVWSDHNKRTDAYGNIRGLGTIQRLKLWRDRYSPSHSIAFYANHGRKWKEYALHEFQADPRNRDDRRKRLQLHARRASVSNPNAAARDRHLSASLLFRSSRSSSSTAATSPSQTPHMDIKYLAVQFSRNDRVQPEREDYRRFMERWNESYNAGGPFSVPFPVNCVELPSTQVSGLSVVMEPGETAYEAQKQS